MYIPKTMEVNDFEKQSQIIRENPLGILFNYVPPKSGLLNYLRGEQEVPRIDSEMCATHVPFFLKENPNGTHKLIAHLAGGNQQINMLKENSNCMIVFQSTDSYITPNWYPQKRETHKFVPTWDFACVHVYGKAHIIEDKSWLLKMLNELTDQEEKKRADEFGKKWKVSETDERYLNNSLNHIVGIEIEIVQIQSKFKVHQDSNPINVRGVLEGYKNEIDPQKARIMSELVKENYPREL